MAKSKLIQAAAITFAVFLAGCAATGQTGSSGGTTGTTGTGSTGEELTLNTDEGVTSEFDALLDQNIIYFDFDKSEIRTEFRTVLNAHAMNLVANPSMTVVLEGHADERGTREYNLALGERRAQAVADYLMLKGVADGQIDTVSYGEERPVALGNTEADYAENRRVEIVY